MRKQKMLKKAIVLLCTTAMVVTGIPVTGNVTQAATVDFYSEESSVMLDKGGFKTEVYGVGTDDWGQTWKDRKDTLPPSVTYLTDNYRETVGTVPTNDWASSIVFDQYSESLYAHPLAYRAASNGMQMAAPAVTTLKNSVDNEPMVESYLNDNTVELVVGGEGFSAKDARVDKTTDWTYEILMENNAGTSSMRATLAKGTPYAYYTFENLKATISLGAGATDLAIYKNSTSSNCLGVSLKNKKDGKTHYYSVNAPKGTTWTNAGGKLTANMPANAKYLSIAILPDGSDEAWGLYAQYAFNFITDTKVQWEYLKNSSKLVTKYSVTTKNMETGAVGGDTIIALYPHQWRYSEEAYTKYTYDTVRGTMKTIVGTEYVTQMSYNGILTGLPVTDDETTIGQIKDQLGYLYDYRKHKDDPQWICFLEGQYGGYDTYWVGKNLNTLADAIWLSGQFDEDKDMKVITDEMVAGVENYLQFWFDPYSGYISGDFIDDYFYYNEDYGTLIGYPASYATDQQLNDHHFHYGYWIKAAAAVAMKDPEWAKEWGGMVYEMISDFANTNRDGSSFNKNSPAKYPFLRNFDIYEGHSWASGVANYEYDENGKLLTEKGGLSGGNNQESSSEAVNAWASLIMWGEAVGDEQIRDLGIYMYTTEIAAIEDYFYDVHDEIFTDGYEDKDNFNLQIVSRLFGGRYDHTAWWTENPIEASTISMLPITGASLYLGKYPEKVKSVVDSIGENSMQWTNFVNNKDAIVDRFAGGMDMLTNHDVNQDIVAEYYAFYDADAALKMYDVSDDGRIENGESRAHTLGYITSLKKYGTQDFSITASSPFAVVLNKDGVKTYVAENHTKEDQRIYFSDKTYVDVPANSTYEGPKMGNGENPETDASELLGNTQKVNLEVYLENYAGTGYDKSNRQINVKADTETYTYQPQNISGFTFDAANANNVLTAPVKEDNSGTIKVYYKRNSYTVQYSLAGGTISGNNPASYRYGSTIALNPAVKEGFRFEGWYTDAQYTNQITGITESTAGNLVLYAKFLDESTISSYTVEYYKQKEDKSGYEIVSEDTKTISSIIGTKVSAEAKNYDGYVLNSNSVTEGTVLADNKLVLRLYYDLEKGNGGELTEGRGAFIGADNSLTFVINDAQDKSMALVYYKLCDNKTEAQSVFDSAVSSNGAGMPGYYMDKEGTAFKKNIGKVQDSQYVVYRFNIQDQEFTDWVMVSVAELKDQSAQKKKADYRVRYYLQKADFSGYEEKSDASEKFTGIVGEAVVAKVKAFNGYSINTAKSKLTGVVKDDNSLELEVYYDKEPETTVPPVTTPAPVETTTENGVTTPETTTPDVTGGGTDQTTVPDVTGGGTEQTTVPDVTGDGTDQTTTPVVTGDGDSKNPTTTAKVSVTTKKVKPPKKVKKLKIKKKARRKINIKWKKIKGVRGYQVAIRIGKKGKFKVRKTIRRNKNRYIKARLKKKKVYYIKVRAYKVVGKKKIYGKYSAVKKYRVK